jgi:hypothetical protein
VSRKTEGLRLKQVFLLGLLLGVAAVAAAQTFDIEPPNPMLAGTALSIKLQGLPAGEHITLTAERKVEAPAPSPRFSRSALIRASAW